jgi:hypothetical protein
MSRLKFVPSKVMDFTLKIREVLAETNCERHSAPVGIPCFHLRMDSHEGYYAGICNVRATKIYNGVPSKSPRTLHKEKR